MATVSQARNFIVPAMPHQVLRVFSPASLCTSIRLARTGAPTFHCGLLQLLPALRVGLQSSTGRGWLWLPRGSFLPREMWNGCWQ